MRQLPLGTSEINASVVGLGTWGIGGWLWGGVDQDQAVRAIHAAIDHGINLIDTAPIYGFGLSESLVGQAIRQRRDHVVLATKCGLVTNTKAGVHKVNADISGRSDHGHINVRVYLDPQSIREEIEASLARLGTDRIDLYQTHWQDSTTPIQDTMSELSKLKDEGKIRAIGVCNASPEQMEQYRKYGGLDSDQEQYSMLDRGIEHSQLPYCRENNMSVLAYSPLAKGLLTGQIKPGDHFEQADHRSGDEQFKPENITAVNKMLDALEPISEQHGLTIAQLVIAWTLHQPGLTHALCGARTPEHASANAKAGSIQLKDDELNLIEATIRDYQETEVVTP